jgi:uroporphyrinogen-III decarboxylase
VTAIWGNIDPVSVLARGTPEDVAMKVREVLRIIHSCGHSRFVLSSGCTLAMETAAANLQALIETAHIGIHS